MLKDLKEFEQKHYIVAVASFFALIGPGLLCLFHYQNQLIMPIGVIKLLLLSSSLTLPLVILNFVFIAIPMETIDEDTPENGPMIGWVTSSFAAATVMYGALFIAYLRSMSFREFVYLIIFFEISLIFAFRCRALFMTARKKFAKKASEKEDPE